MKRLLALCTACALLLAGATATAQQHNATEARLWSDPERTRLVLESSAPLPYEVGTLTAPQRFFIDITDADLRPQMVNALADQPLPPAYLNGLRAARHDADTLRVVFDLSDAVKYRIERIRPMGQYRHRLVVDIIPQTPPAEDPLGDFLAQLGREKTPAGGKPFVVVIDPGHGGEDPGAVSPNNRYEKDVVLRISRRLAEAVNRRPGMRAVLTRDADKFIPLYKRVRIAHDLDEELDVGAFVSVHADSVKRRSARGSSVYILSQKGASSKFAKRLAKEANLSDLMGGYVEPPKDRSTDTALRQISQDGKDRASYQLASLILANLKKINKLHSKRVESAGFAVLKSPRIPSVLVETAFISNPVEEKKLLDAHFQQQLAEALADALETYYRRQQVQE